MDTEQTEVSPTKEVEEAQKVPALCDQSRTGTRPSPTNMGEDEQVAVGYEDRG